MKRLSWKLWVGMSLPIALILAVGAASQIPPTPTQKLINALRGTWRSTARPETLDIVWSSRGRYTMFIEPDKSEASADQRYGDLQFVDGSHILMDDNSKWMPGKLIRVSISEDGGEMLLDPSNGKSRAKISRWIRAR